MRVSFVSALFLSVALLTATVQGAAATSTSDAGQQADSAKQVKQVLNLFFTALHKASISQAYYGYTSTEFRQATNWRDFQVFVQRFPSLDRNLDYDIEKPDFYDTTATVNVNTSSADHKENLVVFDMIFQAGQWRILGIQIYNKQGERGAGEGED